MGPGGIEAQKASSETLSGQVGLQRESREVSMHRAEINMRIQTVCPLQTVQ